MTTVKDWNAYPNFSEWEFTCRCCKMNKTAEALVAHLQALRFLLNRPIIITSGCRCEDHNRHVQGVPNSYHLPLPARPACAADILIPGMSMREMLKAAERIPAFAASGIGIYPTLGFIHVDLGHPSPTRWGQVQRRHWLSVLDTIVEAAKIIVPAIL